VKDTPAVPSLAVLRPRRADIAADTDDDNEESPLAVAAASKPRNRLPAWEDVLFGSDAAPRSSAP
jgi:hypothetical protein